MADLERLYAVVLASRPEEIVAVTGAPFDADSLEDAETEVWDTYSNPLQPSSSPASWLEECGWKVVPLTPELEEQYRVLEGT